MSLVYGSEGGFLQPQRRPQAAMGGIDGEVPHLSGYCERSIHPEEPWKERRRADHMVVPAGANEPGTAASGGVSIVDPLETEVMVEVWKISAQKLGQPPAFFRQIRGSDEEFHVWVRRRAIRGDPMSIPYDSTAPWGD